MGKNFLDRIEKIKRGPAIMQKKDIGIILTNTSINKDSTVLDAGTGSGTLSAFLSQFVKKVYSYEKSNQFLDLAKENFDFLKINNIELKNKDIYEGIEETNLDLITLDLLKPWLVLKHAESALKQNGYLTAYVPNVTQIQELTNDMPKSFRVEKILENIERTWLVKDKIAKPEHTGLMHTGFLIILRKN
jgi:tRNA (adenine57-N1/adenine58-N1)-methyltransferase catalytic subunit